MKGYSYLGYKKNDLPITEKLSKEIFSLPLYPLLKQQNIFRIIKIIKKLKI